MPKQKHQHQSRVNKRSLGSQYEQMARDYLKNLGYMILAQNFYSRFGEIDIIARDHEYIVFVEVKFRKTKRYGYPREAVTYYKKQHLIKAAEYFLLKYMGRETACRFDVIEILNDKLTHLKAVF